MSYALGIPEKKITPPPTVTKPTKVEFSTQLHSALRAGNHVDLRLGLGGKAHSWAIRNWPTKVDEKVLAVHQPVHTREYQSWSGTIKEGYGAGKVTLDRHGDAEIIESSPDKVKFVTYDKDSPEEYVMVHTNENNWILWRRKVTASVEGKPKFKSLPTLKTKDAPTTFDAIQPKIDGAYSLSVFGKPGEQVRVFSPRISKRTGKRIEYTHKIPGILGMRTPKELADTHVRGEVVAMKDGKSQGHTATAAALNTKNPLESKDKQNTLGTLTIFPFGLDKFKGKDMQDADFQSVLDHLKTVESSTGWKVPEVATTPEAKARLWNKIESGKHPLTDEGVMGVNFGPGNKPVKAKLRPSADVVIREVYPGAKPGEAGGFRYSATHKSPIVGSVGTGFSRAERVNMLKNPQDYVRRKATVEYQKGGKRALRAPSFVRMHLDY